MRCLMFLKDSKCRCGAANVYRRNHRVWITKLAWYQFVTVSKWPEEDVSGEGSGWHKEDPVTQHFQISLAGSLSLYLFFFLALFCSISVYLYLSLPFAFFPYIVVYGSVSAVGWCQHRLVSATLGAVSPVFSPRRFFSAAVAVCRVGGDDDDTAPSSFGTTTNWLTWAQHPHS